MHKKRLGFILGVFGAFAVFLVAVQVRIFFVNGDEYTKNAISQRVGSVMVKSHRGKILDRNLVPLVENSVEKYFVGESENFVSIPVRYSSDSIARHLVGYIDGDGVGISGIEKCFDAILGSKTQSRINVIKSADGSLAEGLGMSLNDAQCISGSVSLTIDSHIQKIAEDVMIENGVTGAVVVMDAANFDVLAMASMPDFDQNNVEDYLSLNDGELINRCLWPYNAGSIFKTVTLCAAGEYSTLRSEYVCTGHIDVYEKSYACHLADGHGAVAPRDAFAKSCNCAFYTMGLDMGDDAILAMAQRFGLGSPLLADCTGLGEDGGNIPSANETVFVDSVNLSIGQGEILITPLQAANMVCIIANGGISKDVNIVKDIRTSEGNAVWHMKRDKDKRAVSEKTASLIQESMALAVTDGTGKALGDSPAKIAGKTGTAETGWVKDGRTLVHGWFCGYFPSDNPKYAMAVLTEDGGSGSASAAPVFKEIAEGIIKIYPVG